MKPQIAAIEDHILLTAMRTLNASPYALRDQPQ